MISKFRDYLNHDAFPSQCLMTSILVVIINLY